MANSFLVGVNLAGAEFGTNVPGVYGADYTYPTHAEIDYYASKGMSVIRMPFLWERLQFARNGTFDATELGRLDDVVNYATGKGLRIEIEPHNYGYGFGALIGSVQTPNSAFADFWGKLALHFKMNSQVIFGLMNEPHDQSASAWIGSVNAAIAAIRDAGAVQEILVPGSYWDGAWTWTSTDNAAVVGTGVQDPAHNFAFEVHQYLDPDGSGTHSGVVSPTIGVERLTAITQWAGATGSHLFLGEVGISTDQTSLTALDGMLTYMQQHPNAWEGVTYWAGGPWWGNYMFSIEPRDGVDKPQMTLLVQHMDDVDSVAINVTARHHSITDFNPDSSDVPWQRTDGTLMDFHMNGPNLASFAIAGNVGPQWQITGTADYNGDHATDLLFRRDDGSLLLQTLVNNHVQTETVIGPVGNEWQVLGSSDFNGDSRDDILWRRTDGTLMVFDMNGPQITAAPIIGKIGTEWSLQGAGDYNGDGTGDMLWRRGDGSLLMFEIANNQVQKATIVGQVGNEWQIAGSGDFNGDHKTDILWQRGDGALMIFDMNGPQITSVTNLASPGAGWTLEGAADYTHDGTADLLWQHAGDGALLLDEMLNNQVNHATSIGHVGAEWHLL